ncbi:conserved hypothetical protein [Musicola paradisiaca Ech703]|uniref:Uncharacterized protein n=2 Tax=Musicola paradisiaca TaxID=69223 RepID=C6C712_MUSP7|nr:conserved hypothetical protein [Musicola paradisiaca Ech703]
MRRIMLTIMFAVTAFLFLNQAEARNMRLSDDQVKQKIIDESIAGYSGTCACPYNSARNGSTCGGRSAWSRKGGAAPTCYKNEVTKERVTRWRQQNNAAPQ